MCASRTLAMISSILLALGQGCEPSEPGDHTAAEVVDGAGLTGALDQGPTLVQRFLGAERVVVGVVVQVRAAFAQNEHGDELIISTVTLQVQQSLRGEDATTATFELEGGTVGDLTLEVSDLPSLVPGDRGVFALRRSRQGSWVPNRRALGILLMSLEPDLLDRARRAERVSR